MTNTNRRARFTLVEMMVVLALAALCLGVLGLRGSRSLIEGRIDSAASLLAHKIEIVSRKMVALNEDLELRLFLNRGELALEVTSRGDALTPSPIGRDPISGIDRIEWNGTAQEEIVLRFSALSGGLCDRGLLAIHSSRGASRTLVVTGCPGAVEVTHDPPPLQANPHPPYPDALANLSAS